MKAHPKHRAKKPLAHRMAGMTDKEEPGEDPKEEAGETPLQEDAEPEAGEAGEAKDGAGFFKKIAKKKR